MNRSLAKSSHSFRDDLWDLFDRFSFDVPTLSSSNERFLPKIEVKDAGNTYQVCAEIPGMDEKDINLSLQDNQLIIEGEKKDEFKEEDKKKGYYHSEFSYGRFYRAIPLNDDVDTNHVDATYKNGVLNVELKKNPERATRNKKIAINTGHAARLPESKSKH